MSAPYYKTIGICLAIVFIASMTGSLGYKFATAAPVTPEDRKAQLVEWIKENSVVYKAASEEFNAASSKMRKATETNAGLRNALCSEFHLKLDDAGNEVAADQCSF